MSRKALLVLICALVLMVGIACSSGQNTSSLSVQEDGSITTTPPVSIPSPSATINATNQTSGQFTDGSSGGTGEEDTPALHQEDPDQGNFTIADNTGGGPALVPGKENSPYADQELIVRYRSHPGKIVRTRSML